MNNFKATQTDWVNVEHSAIIHAAEACILELRSRIEQLEAQASNYPEIPDSSTPPPVARVTRDKDETGNYVIVHNTATPPPVATDEDLWKLWAEFGFAAFRIIYNLGIKHGQASSREMEEPAPVAEGLTERVKLAIDSALYDEDDHQWHEGRAAILEVETWLREQGWEKVADLIEQEAGR